MNILAIRKMPVPKNDKGVRLVLGGSWYGSAKGSLDSTFPAALVPLKIHTNALETIS
jgi:hypothetical protein